MDDIERAMWGTPIDPEVSALRKRVAVLEAGLRQLVKACEVYENAFDVDEAWTLYDGAKRHAKRVLGGVPATEGEGTAALRVLNDLGFLGGVPAPEGDQ